MSLAFLINERAQSFNCYFKLECPNKLGENSCVNSFFKLNSFVVTTIN